VVYGGEVIGESAIEFEEKIGAEIIHTFEVMKFFLIRVMGRVVSFMCDREIINTYSVEYA
jgi:hypothetical protein